MGHILKLNYLTTFLISFPHHLRLFQTIHVAFEEQLMSPAGLGHRDLVRHVLFGLQHGPGIVVAHPEGLRLASGLSGRIRHRAVIVKEERRGTHAGLVRAPGHRIDRFLYLRRRAHLVHVHTSLGGGRRGDLAFPGPRLGWWARLRSRYSPERISRLQKNTRGC